MNWKFDETVIVWWIVIEFYTGSISKRYYALIPHVKQHDSSSRTQSTMEDVFVCVCVCLRENCKVICVIGMKVCEKVIKGYDF